MEMKRQYDNRHTPKFFRESDWVTLCLHKGYTQAAITHLKIDAQFAGQLRVLQRIGCLAYKLDLPPTCEYTQ